MVVQKHVKFSDKSFCSQKSVCLTSSLIPWCSEALSYFLKYSVSWCVYRACDQSVSGFCRLGRVLYTSLGSGPSTALLRSWCPRGFPVRRPACCRGGTTVPGTVGLSVPPFGPVRLCSRHSHAAVWGPRPPGTAVSSSAADPSVAVKTFVSAHTRGSEFSMPASPPRLSQGHGLTKCVLQSRLRLTSGCPYEVLFLSSASLGFAPDPVSPPLPRPERLPWCRPRGFADDNTWPHGDCARSPLQASVLPSWCLLSDCPFFFLASLALWRNCVFIPFWPPLVAHQRYLPALCFSGRFGVWRPPRCCLCVPSGPAQSLRVTREAHAADPCRPSERCLVPASTLVIPVL